MKEKHSQALLVRYISVVLSVVALVTLISIQSSPTAAETPAFVRIVHAAPGIGTADIFVDGTKLLSSFQFAEVTDYVPVPPGSHKVQAALIGQGPNAAVLTQTLTISPGNAYTVAALGTQSIGFSLQVFQDNNSVSGTQAKVRVYQLSPDAGPISLAAGSNMVISGLTYRQASSYLAVPAGSYTFNMTTTQGNTSLPIATMLKPSTVTSIFTVGTVNGTPKIQLVSAEVSGTPGMPQTGSDPNALSGSSQPLIPWLLAILLLAAIGTGMVTLRLTVACQKTTIRSRE